MWLHKMQARRCEFEAGNQIAPQAHMENLRSYVYILKNSELPPRHYTGLTSDLRARLDAHNAGKCKYTSTGIPWRLDVVIKFADEARAIKLERYLKSGSGIAFARRHLR